MKRLDVPRRPEWQTKLEAEGCYYHTIDGQPYWNEAVCYEFTAEEIDAIEEATQELHQLCMEHVNDVVSRGDYHGYNHLSDHAKATIEASWKYGHPSIYGRFDLGVNFETNQIKMYEYNSDTPTALPEASIWQYSWLKEQYPLADQFNSIHEALIKEFEWFKGFETDGPNDPQLYFAASKQLHYEDWGNVSYMADCATQAGCRVSVMSIDDIGWTKEKKFVDLNDREIRCLFKLYPWEWAIDEEFGREVIKSTTMFIEPPWKMLLSTKALLPLLWQREPNHPNLLEAYFEVPGDRVFVRKPVLGREGSNISQVLLKSIPQNYGNPTPTLDLYDQHGYVLQQQFAPQRFGNKIPVIGSWVVGSKSVGMGIREDGFITTNTSQFVPHFFVKE